MRLTDPVPEAGAALLFSVVSEVVYSLGRAIGTHYLL